MGLFGRNNDDGNGLPLYLQTGDDASVEYDEAFVSWGSGGPVHDVDNEDDEMEMEFFDDKDNNNNSVSKPPTQATLVSDPESSSKDDSKDQFDNDDDNHDDDFQKMVHKRRKRVLIAYVCLCLTFVAVALLVVFGRDTDDSPAIVPRTISLEDTTEAETLAPSRSPTEEPTLTPGTIEVEAIDCGAPNVYFYTSFIITIDGTTAGLTEEDISLLQRASADSYTYASVLACDDPYHRAWSGEPPIFTALTDQSFRLDIQVAARGGGPRPLTAFDASKSLSLVEEIYIPPPPPPSETNSTDNDGERFLEWMIDQRRNPNRQLDEGGTCSILDVITGPDLVECQSNSSAFTEEECECRRDGCYCFEFEGSSEGGPSPFDFQYFVNEYLDYIRLYGVALSPKSASMDTPDNEMRQLRAQEEQSPRKMQDGPLQNFGYVLEMTALPVETEPPTTSPTESQHPSAAPSISALPTDGNTHLPSSAPSFQPSTSPTGIPSMAPSFIGSSKPSHTQSDIPTVTASQTPSTVPSTSPSVMASAIPSMTPSVVKSDSPSTSPSTSPSVVPTASPSATRSEAPSTSPSTMPSTKPSTSPSTTPSRLPSASPTNVPSSSPTDRCEDIAPFRYNVGIGGQTRGCSTLAGMSIGERQVICAFTNAQTICLKGCDTC